MRFELTNEIVKVIEFCPFLENKDNHCEYCPLIGACYEYWMDDNRFNKDIKEE